MEKAASLVRIAQAASTLLHGIVRKQVDRALACVVGTGAITCYGALGECSRTEHRMEQVGGLVLQADEANFDRLGPR